MEVMTSQLPTKGKFYKFRTIILCPLPEVMPAEPITKPAPTTIPQPAEDDPFNVPAPKINPTPKGFSVAG
jgi:hypothetical protein